jgi:hypothetical protein
MSNRLRGIKAKIMKKLLTCTIALFTISFVCHAQRAGKVSWNASKADILDKDGNLVESLPGKVLVQTSKAEILLGHDDQGADDLKGAIRELSCNWKDSFKNGKSIFKSDLVDASGEIKESIVTIEGVDGKITITVTKENHEGKKIRIVVDSFKEDNS